MNYRIHGLPADRFSHLFGRSDADLQSQGVLRFRIEAPDSAPDRISLRDAQPGETVLLLNHEHLDVDTPYRSRHAIYVIEGEHRTFDAVNEVPQVMRRRVLAVRAFDEKGMMLDADIVDGQSVEPLIERLFANPRAAYLHAHYAKRGCFAARIDRA